MLAGMTKSKRKGTAGESAVVSFLRTVGFPYAERLALQGSKDRGDITGIPGVVIECKASDAYLWSTWLNEARVEKENANATHAFVASKPRGVGSTRTGDWFAGMYLGDYVSLLEDAGVELGTVWTQNMPGTYINRDLLRMTGLAKVHALEGDCDWWLVEISPKGVKDPAMFYAVTSLAQMSSLLVKAGYGSVGG
jgi:hypothetical protein